MKEYSVTTVLSAFNDFSGVHPDIIEYAGLRGSVVHEASANYAAGKYVSLGRLEKFDPKARGFFLSFKNWFDEYVHRPIMIEQYLHCDTYGFYGHLDLYALMVDGRKVITDIKTPVSPAQVWKGQLAAYRHLVCVNTGDLSPAQSLILNNEGRPPKAVTYQDSDSDWAAFLSALNAYRYFKA